MTVTRPMVAHWRLVCLLCGRDNEINLPEGVADMTGPIRCTDCGGRVMAEYEGLSLPDDTLPRDLWPTPPRGRPPRWLTELRKRQEQEILDGP